jgi:hypothetical protein
VGELEEIWPIGVLEGGKKTGLALSVSRTVLLRVSSEERAELRFVGFTPTFLHKRHIPFFSATSAFTEPNSFTPKIEVVRSSETSEHKSRM